MAYDYLKGSMVSRPGFSTPDPSLVERLLSDPEFYSDFIASSISASAVTALRSDPKYLATLEYFVLAHFHANVAIQADA